jgi:hypothetical protein
MQLVEALEEQLFLERFDDAVRGVPESHVHVRDLRSRPPRTDGGGRAS